MQNAKDSFYVMLRDRIAGINGARTVAIRGVSRPGVLVAENELATTLFAVDAFSLWWTGVSVDRSEGMAHLQCEISYATDGTSSSSGMDRGRLLAEMDLELTTALRREPQNIAKTAYSGDGTMVMPTKIFWTDPVFGKTGVSGDRLSRGVTVDVFAYQEAGEQ